MSHSVSKSKTSPASFWASAVDPSLLSTLADWGVEQEVVDPWTIRLSAVPLANCFNKPRTNLLVRQRAGRIWLYVDCDLVYEGANRMLVEAFEGASERNWRRLTLTLRVGRAGVVIRDVLHLLQSPAGATISERLTTATGQPSIAAETLEGLPPHSILATETVSVPVSDTVAAFRSCLRKGIARRLAVAATRQPPVACLLWGTTGTGKDHLLRASAHVLIQGERCYCVRRLAAGRLTCGCIVAAQRDSLLSNLCDELVARPDILLLMDQLDLTVSGTAASFTLLADAVDRGVKILATVRDKNFLNQLGSLPWLARRVLPIHVPSLNQAQTLKALSDWARDSRTEVAPAALQTAIQSTQQQRDSQPAAALELLEAARAEANWRSRKTITPDDVTSVLRPDWPE